MTRIAKCHCGALSLNVEGEPQHIFMCHCELCQRRTGSSYNLGAWFPVKDVAISGQTNTYTRKGETGVKADFYFCPTCGTNLFWQAPEMLPDMLGVAVGCFADANFPPPTASAYEKRRHRWLKVPDGIPCFAGNAI